MNIRIGVRELRQHASRYLRLVRAGEVITVTDRGEPIAEIHPATRRNGLDRLIAEGRARPPIGDFAEYLEGHRPAAGIAGEQRLSDLVIEARRDDRA